MVLDGLLADRKGVGDLLVRHSLGDVVQDLDLARGKRSEDGGRLLAVDRQLAELLQNAARYGWLGEDLSSGRLERMLEGHTRPVWAVAVTPDGARIVSGGGSDDTVRVWDLSSGRLERPIRSWSTGGLGSS
jgi:WD40 repeat protein